LRFRLQAATSDGHGSISQSQVRAAKGLETVQQNETEQNDDVTFNVQKIATIRPPFSTPLRPLYSILSLYFYYDLPLLSSYLEYQALSMDLFRHK
jgi:hypothetical protein